MNCTRANQLLRGYLDGELSVEEKLLVKSHLESCPTCSGELAVVEDLLPEASWLPQNQASPGVLTRTRDTGLESPDIPPEKVPAGGRLRRRPTRPVVTARSPSSRPHLSKWRIPRLGAVVIIAIAVGCTVFALSTMDVAWGVAQMEGLPHLRGEPFTGRADLRVGDWLETDEWSSVRIEVGMIGQIDVEPGTQLRLIEATDTDHRIFLESGTIHATIWATPRLFFVQTPHALATDLGCEYSLKVDHSGEGYLVVTSGSVVLTGRGREATVPAGTSCRILRHLGPGTPFALSSSVPLQDALARLDREPEANDALEVVLKEARREDALSLWHLLTRVCQEERGKVFDRLAQLAPPPRTVVKDEVLEGNAEMLSRWGESLGISHSGSELR